MNQMPKYSDLSTKIEGNGVSLRSIVEDDLEMVRYWRNDPKISQHMLTQNYITRDNQLSWFEAIKNDIEQQHFVIVYKREPIGVTNIKSIQRGGLTTSASIESGLYIYDDRYRGSFLAFCPALTINDYCFDQLGCEKLIARVLPDNEAALRFNASLGYEKIDGYEETERSSLVVMTLTKARYQLKSQDIRRFIRF